MWFIHQVDSIVCDEVQYSRTFTSDHGQYEYDYEYEYE